MEVARRPARSATSTNDTDQAFRSGVDWSVRAAASTKAARTRITCCRPAAVPRSRTRAWRSLSSRERPAAALCRYLAASLTVPLQPFRDRELALGVLELTGLLQHLRQQVERGLVVWIEGD